jgi:hypothetical protein
VEDSAETVSSTSSAQHSVRLNHINLGFWRSMFPIKKNIGTFRGNNLQNLNYEFNKGAGTLIKDSIQFSQGQLISFRTAYWNYLKDSFKLKVIIKPKVRGIFFVGLGQQGNRDVDCALYKYFLKVINPDQHLYYLAQTSNGFISDNARNYAYCFKVY